MSANLLSSLDLVIVRARKYDAIGLALTLGFIFLVGLVEVAVPGLAIAGIYFFSEKYTKMDLSPWFRFLLLAWFALGWLNLFLAIFNISTF